MGLHKPDPLHGVEHIVYNVAPEDLPKPRSNEMGFVLHGYAVQHSGSHRSGWLFFRAPEPAYVYGRAARMAHGSANWQIRHAAYEMKFNRKLERDVSTLYLSDDAPIRDYKKGDPLAATWQTALTPRSSHWTPPDRSRKQTLSQIVDDMERRHGPVDEALVSEILARLNR